MPAIALSSSSSHIAVGWRRSRSAIAISTPDVRASPRLPDDATPSTAHRGDMETLIEGTDTNRTGTEPAVNTAGTRATTDDAVVVSGLTKRYGNRAAVDNLSFTVPAGSVAGLIGPNGAGKTTLMAMLLGLVRPTEGSGTVLGQSVDRPADYLGRVGALIEGPAFHPAVSGIDNLRSLAVLGGHDQAEIPGLLELVGLAGRGDDRYGSYSMGMKQRLGIAASLLGDPELVILDEPTNGLDPVGMQDIRRLIGDIAAGGRTVIVSSHLLSELEQVCDWLIVIDHGGLVYLGRPEMLTGTESIVIRTAEPSDLPILHSMVASTHLPVATTDDG